MALIKCPDCGKEFSDQAAACPNCGRPNRLVGPPRARTEGLFLRTLKVGGAITLGIAVLFIAFCVYIADRAERLRPTWPGATGSGLEATDTARVTPTR